MEKPLRSYYNRHNLLWGAVVAIAFTVIIIVATQSVTLWHVLFAVLIWLSLPAIKAREDLIRAYEATTQDANDQLDEMDKNS